MKTRRNSAVTIFVGALLVTVFVVGLIAARNPAAFVQKNRYDYALEQFVSFCSNWWLPAGIIGIPTLLGSLILTLVRESKDKQKEHG